MTATTAEESNGQRVVGSFQKSTTASIRVSLVEWQGDTYVDVRQVVPSDKPGERFINTRKGIRFKVDLVGELLKLLEAVPCCTGNRGE